MHFDSIWLRPFVVVLPLAITAIAVLAGCSEEELENAGAQQASAGETPAQSNAARPLPGDDQLQAMLDEVVDLTEQRHLTAKDHAAWQIVHGILAYGHNLQIEVNGELVGALDYLLDGGKLNGWNFKPGEKGLDAILETGSKTGQGHEDQWLGYLSQCGLELTQPIQVGGMQYTFNDLLTQAQWDVHDGMEASWTLMAVSAYLPSDATWTARDGGTWSIERLIAMEAAQGLDGAACGGSHRMGGIAMALNRHLGEGGQLTGGWLAADTKVQDCIAKCRQFQQPDGTFSTNYWIRASGSPDSVLRLNTTGHQLEFLALAMTDEQIKEPWVTRAAAELCRLIKINNNIPVECGGLYHAAHGLQIYRLRRFGDRQ